MTSTPEITEPDPLDRPDAAWRSVRGGGLRAAAWALSAALSLVSIPLLVHHLGVADFGRYVAVMSVISIAALVSDLGLGALTLREWSAAPAERRPQVLRALLSLRLAIVAVAAIAALVFTLVAGYPQRMVLGALVAIPGLFAQVFGDLALVVLAGTLRFGRVAAIELLRAAASTLAIVVLVLVDAAFAWFFAAWSLSAFFAAGVALRQARAAAGNGLGAAGFAPRLRPSEWREFAGSTATYAAASAAHVIYFRAVMLIVSLRATPFQAGLFAIPYRIVEFVAAVAAVLSGTAVPVLTRQDDEGLRQRTLQLVRLLAGAGAVVAVVVALGAPLLMNAIGGDRADDAVPVARILAATIFTIFTTFGMGAVLLVLERYRALLAINLGALVVAVLAALVLVPDHGARGGAWAALMAEVVLLGGQLLVLGATFRRRPRRLPSR